MCPVHLHAGEAGPAGDAGCEREPVDDVQDLLQLRDRLAAAETASATLASS